MIRSARGVVSYALHEYPYWPASTVQARPFYPLSGQRDALSRRRQCLSESCKEAGRMRRKRVTKELREYGGRRFLRVHVQGSGNPWHHIVILSNLCL